MDSNHYQQLTTLKDEFDRHTFTLEQVQTTVQQCLAQVADLERQLHLIADAEGIVLEAKASTLQAPAPPPEAVSSAPPPPPPSPSASGMAHGASPSARRSHRAEPVLEAEKDKPPAADKEPDKK